MNDKKLMTLAADNIRILAASMVEKAKSGHPGGAMGGADFINVLFSEFLVYDPENPSWEGRDRFFLDPGHMSPMLYSALCLQGKFTLDELKEFRQWGSPTPGHPERDIERGIENTSGPLGQGHTFAAGAAVAEKFLEARLGKEVMQHNWSNMVINRKYVAVLEGQMEKREGEIRSYLAENSLFEVYSTDDPAKGQLAVTRFRTIWVGNGYSLVEFELDTGRKNQIRVHAKDMGHPIVGDRKYGASKSPIHRLALHAMTLRFVHPITRKEMNFTTPIPPNFAKLTHYKQSLVRHRSDE